MILRYHDTPPPHYVGWKKVTKQKQNVSNRGNLTWSKTSSSCSFSSSRNSFSSASKSSVWVRSARSFFRVLLAVITCLNSSTIDFIWPASNNGPAICILSRWNTLSLRTRVCRYQESQNHLGRIDIFLSHQESVIFRICIQQWCDANYLILIAD